MKKAEEEHQKNKRINLDNRKTELERPDQKYVYLNKDNIQELIHRVPENEHDTLALLWKLEAKKILPFDYFVSLEHTSLEGIDIIAHFRETPDSHTNKYVPIEVEHICESFIPHGHNINQVIAIICWDVADEDKFKKISGCEYKLFLQINEKDIPVYRISKLNHIQIRDNTGKVY